MNKHVVTNLIILALLTTSFVLLGWKEGAMWFALLFGATAPWWTPRGGRSCRFCG